MNTKQKLDKAFEMMSAAGLLAEQNFMCCGSCAGYELSTQAATILKEEDRRVAGCVFYHGQDAENRNHGNDFYLRYGPLHTTEHGTIGESTEAVGCMVIGALTLAGVEHEWDGDPNHAIVIKGCDPNDDWDEPCGEEDDESDECSHCGEEGCEGECMCSEDEDDW
jgi:hypothetical protein